MPTKDDHEWILPLKKPTPDHVIDAMRHGLDIGLGKSYANLTRERVESVTDEDVVEAIEMFRENIGNNNACIAILTLDLPGTVKQPDDDTDDEVAICEQENKCYNLAIQALQAYQKPTGETSDGYHTFNELYEHRTALFAALCNTYNDRSWKSFKHADGTMYDGMFIAGIETPEGQYTYHCEEEYLYMFAMTKEMPNAPEWDGHKPSDYSRLFALNLKEGYRPEREL